MELEADERDDRQRGFLTVEPSQYGFAVIWNLQGAEPSVLLHRQAEDNALKQMQVVAHHLVRDHGWELDRKDGSTTYLKRRTQPEF